MSGDWHYFNKVVQEALWGSDLSTEDEKEIVKKRTRGAEVFQPNGSDYTKKELGCLKDRMVSFAGMVWSLNLCGVNLATACPV